MHAPQTNTMHKKTPGQVRVEMSGKSTSDGGIQPLRERSTLWMFPVAAVQMWMDAHTAPVCTNCHAWLQQLYLDLVGCWEQPWQPCRKSGREESLTLYSWDAHATQHTWLGQLRESSVWKKKNEKIVQHRGSGPAFIRQKHHQRNWGLDKNSFQKKSFRNMLVVHHRERLGW